MWADNADYKKCLELAEHYKAIGEVGIYLSGDQEKPWHLVTKVDVGAGWRISAPTSLSIIASDHESGLEFRWSEDLEPREANGSNVYQFDTKNLRSLLRKVPAKARADALNIIRDKILPSVLERANEYESALNTQQEIHASLKQLVSDEATQHGET